VELDPFSHAFHEDPYPVYRWLRDHDPVYRSAEGWYALSRYDDVLDASQQPIRFSSAQGTSLELIDTASMLPMIIFMDPPRHDRQRKLVSRAFTPRAISDLEPFVRATAARFLDALVEQGGGDFVEEFSAVLPTPETTGDFEEMCLLAGESAAVIRAVAPAGEIVRHLVADAEALLGARPLPSPGAVR